MNPFEEAGERLAQELRGLRSSHGMSLDTASVRSGISRRLLVALEKGTANPSLSTLLRLAEGYGVGLADLVGAAETPPISVRADHDARILWRTDAGSVARLLIASEDLELWTWVIAPGDTRVSDGHRPGTKEILQMNRGRLAVSVEGNRKELTTGEVALFAADRPHSFENPWRAPALFLLVVHEPVR